MPEESLVPADYIPKLGHQLEGPGIRMIVEAVQARQQNFPEEKIDETIPIILLNIGSRYVPLRCEGKEWKGYKKDIVLGDGPPTCPNGHAIIKEKGMVLGWVNDPN